MNSIIKRVSVGFLYGIGFFMAVTILSVLSRPYIESMNQDERRARVSELSLMHSKYQSDSDSSEFQLLGKITNASEIAWPSVEIVASINDSKNTLVRTCQSSINETLESKSTIDIVLSCAW